MDTSRWWGSEDLKTRANIHFTECSTGIGFTYNLTHLDDYLLTFETVDVRFRYEIAKS